MTVYVAGTDGSETAAKAAKAAERAGTLAQATRATIHVESAHDHRLVRLIC